MTVVDFPQEGVIGADLQPKRYDIAIYKGDTFKFALKFMDDATPTPNVIDLTGFTVLSQLRTYVGGVIGGTVSGSFTASTPGSSGIITLTLDTTALLPGDYIYDVQLTDTSSNKRTYIGGKVTVTVDVSS